MLLFEGGDGPLADAPVVVQQVAEVHEVEPELDGVPPSREVLEESCVMLRSVRRTIGSATPFALRVLAAVLAQIVVLLDVGLERGGLLGGREGAARTVNGAKFISDVSRGM